MGKQVYISIDLANYQIFYAEVYKSLYTFKALRDKFVSY